MVAFVIFWAAVLAMLFFVLGIVFKALASAFNALLSSIGGLLAIGGLATLAIIALYLIYAIAHGIATEGIGDVIGTIFLLVIEIGIIGAIFGGLGSILLSIVVAIAEAVLSVISFALEGAANICEKGYAKFLTVIIKRLDKC